MQNYNAIFQEDGSLVVCKNNDYEWSFDQFETSPEYGKFDTEGSLSLCTKEGKVLKTFTGTKGSKPPYKLDLDNTETGWKLSVKDDDNTELYKIADG